VPIECQLLVQRPLPCNAAFNHPTSLNHHTPTTTSKKSNTSLNHQFDHHEHPHPVTSRFFGVVAMAQVPDYSGLEAQWQADCQNWNANITGTNHRQPALANPPPFLKLFHDGYGTFESLKADLDEATKLSGYFTVKVDSGATAGHEGVNYGGHEGVNYGGHEGANFIVLCCSQ
jgi:hypothetical protein